MKESFIGLHNPFINLLMGSSTERSVSAHFAVAKLEITTFTYIKGNRPVSCHDKFALSIAKRVIPRMPARTPVVFFASK